MTSEFSIAVHALVFLNHRAICLSSDVLADNICTNPARVRKVMGKLKKAGLVMTKEGVDGGYLADSSISSITLAQISHALDAKFVSSSWHSGDEDMKCLVASGMADIMDEIYDGLDRLCRDSLDKVTIETIEQRIFGDLLKSPLPPPPATKGKA